MGLAASDLRAVLAHHGRFKASKFAVFAATNTVSWRKAVLASGVPLALVLALGAPASADIIAIIDKTVYREQSGPTTFAEQGAYFYAEAFFSPPGAYNTGTLTYPGPASPEPLALNGYFYTATFFPTQAAMDVAYPVCAYTFKLSNLGLWRAIL